MRIPSTFVAVFALFAILLASPPASPAEPESAAGSDAVEVWPQWRGPERDGRVGDATEATGWPGSLDGIEPLWRRELGKGYSGPIVGRDRVFTVETVVGGEAESIRIRALARADGGELWRREWPSEGSVPFFAARNGDWARSTPAWDGETLYVGDMLEVLAALDGATGEVRWRVDFPARYGSDVPPFGFASSPLVDGDALYVQAADSIVKLDKRTGETIWRSLEQEGGMMSGGAFSSPTLATLSGVEQLLVQTREALHGIDPETGAVLWRQPVPSFRGMNILTPTVHGTSVFTSSYRESSFLYDIRRTADGFVPREAWTHKAHGYMSSPVVIDGHAYLHLGNNRLTCIDLETGESRWTTKPFGEYWSLVYQGNRILALDSGGELHLVEADPAEFRLLDSREIAASPTWGHLAVAGDELFVRELEAIAVYRWGAASPQVAARNGSGDASDPTR